MSRRLLARVVSVGVAAVVVAAASGCQQKVDRPADVPPVHLQAAATIKAPKTGAYTGVFTPPAPFEMTYVDDYAQKAGRSPSIVMWFQPWVEKGSSRFDKAAVVSVLQRGCVPMITWEPWDPGNDANLLREPAKQSAYRLKRINDGEFDAYIRSWAKAAKELGGPVMIRPMHEMNGNWYPWCGSANGNQPEEYRKAWRHIVDIFDKEGATNVTWVWSINRESVPDANDNSFAAYYPGDAYVDWTSISGFNWGTSRPSTQWTSFSELYEAPLAYLRTVGKPIVLSEFGCVPDGGDKAAWIADAYGVIKKHPEIDAVIYYDKLEQGLKLTQDWRISSSKKSEAAYKAAIADTYYLSSTPPELEQWGNGLSQTQWTYLRTIQPVY
ncbi:MAG TPA: glycosyl hydrolase [Coriobacteriia bacterium]|nr:glycosyl hydrolase [Coriobacteriia bacterium]